MQENSIQFDILKIVSSNIYFACLGILDFYFSESSHEVGFVQVLNSYGKLSNVLIAIFTIKKVCPI